MFEEMKAARESADRAREKLVASIEALVEEYLSAHGQLHELDLGDTELKIDDQFGLMWKGQQISQVNLAPLLSLAGALLAAMQAAADVQTAKADAEEAAAIRALNALRYSDMLRPTPRCATPTRAAP